MGFGQRAGKFNELGKLVSIRPNSGTPMTVIQSFQIQSIGQPASVIHARDPIFKPGTEIALESDALFFMPTESYGADGVPQYTQLVINDGFSNPLKVSEYNEYFTITKPGVMSTAVTSVSAVSYSASSPSVGIAPKAITVPQTYRREGLVEVFLTTSNDADAEVAYSDDGANWCSLSTLDTFVNIAAGTFGVSTKFQTFPKYLVGAGASRTAVMGHAATYIATTRIEATGAISYSTSGIYRSKVVPFLRDESGTQYFLKTNVTFTGANVTSSSSENGSISGTLGGASEGYNEHTAGTSPVYTATPDANRHVVSFTVNGSAQSISDPSAAQQHTFTSIDGDNSIEAVFGYKTTVNISGTGSVTSPSGISNGSFIYRAEGDSIDFIFSEQPASITYDSAAQTVDGTTFTLDGIRANAVFAVTFS